ncbi:MAG: amidase family protein, partial [Promethearchaeia archaeon]
MRRAGAEIIGKTNVPPMCLDVQTFNQVHGTTNNPYDLSRTPGGSSGGSAAAVASGMVPLAIGSDLAGSLRVPASFCGISSFKPTARRISAAGHV